MEKQKELQLTGSLIWNNCQLKDKEHARWWKRYSVYWQLHKRINKFDKI